MIGSGFARPDLAAEYAVRHRLQVHDALSAAAAERLFAYLDTQAEWQLVYNQGAEVAQIDGWRLRAMPAAERGQLLAAIHDGARQGYQFVYSLKPILADYFDPAQPDCLLFELFEFLNGASFLDRMRALTGLGGIRWLDAQATRFRAGQFLKTHTDEMPAQQRLAAYVLNLTKDWGRDWGGYLQFFDGNKDVELGLRPNFNALNLFTIPQAHAVSEVASYCLGSRYAITGWLRGDAPPVELGWRKPLRRP